MTYEVEWQIPVILVVPAGKNDKNRWLLFIALLYVHASEIFNGLDMNPSLFLIGREQLGSEIHQRQFSITIFIDHDLKVFIRVLQAYESLEILSKVYKYFLFAQIVRKYENSVVLMLPDYFF